MPPGIFKLIHGSKYMRYHQTTPQAHLGGRSHEIPQGNVLGGGSSVNAQVYMRGRPSDYDAWDEALRGENDDPGWGWKDVLPHFRGMEGNNRLHDELHGSDGPLLVSDPGHIDDVSRWFVQAGQALGLPYNHDFNGPSQRGVGFYQFMNRRGRRSSAVYAFLAPLERDPRLTIRLRSRARRIVIENGRAVGVVYRDANGQDHTVYADGEIIVASGSLVTPQLLMLSGIGPAAHLKEHGLDCLVDLPGVGANLIDHPEVPMAATLNGRYGYHKQSEGWRMLRSGLQFKLFGSGPVLSAGVEAGAFVDPTDPQGVPKIQAFCVPAMYADRKSVGLLPDTFGVTITTVVVKPRSRGTVRLRSADPDAMPLVSPHTSRQAALARDRAGFGSADPDAMPLVSPQLLADPADMAEMIEGQRFFLRVFQTSPMKQRIDRICMPSPDDLSDFALAEHCRRMVKTNFHPSGTCRMGRATDPMAVLDPKLRVRGVDGLRVCDLSAMPDINSGNTNAPALMFGDRCAGFVSEGG